MKERRHTITLYLSKEEHKAVTDASKDMSLKYNEVVRFALKGIYKMYGNAALKESIKKQEALFNNSEEDTE